MFSKLNNSIEKKKSTEKRLDNWNPPKIPATSPRTTASADCPLPEIESEKTHTNTTDEVKSEIDDMKRIRSKAAAAISKRAKKNSKKTPSKSKQVQRQAQLNAIQEKEVASSNSMKQHRMLQDRKLQFNSSNKGRAMVNHGSLAVHKEKSKILKRQQQEEQNHQKNEEEQGGGSSPFSFGFNFSTLLPQASQN